MADISIKVENSDALHAALSSRIRGLDRAARLFVEDAMDIVQREIAEQLRLKSHPIGTQTPSEPGEPPAMVTGNMIRSITQYGPYYDGPHSATGVVGPTAVQSRIQELGGRTGRDYQTYLPARPYVKPAIEEAHPKLEDSARKHFGDAIRGDGG